MFIYKEWSIFYQILTQNSKIMGTHSENEIWKLYDNILMSVRCLGRCPKFVGMVRYGPK